MSKFTNQILTKRVSSGVDDCRVVWFTGSMKTNSNKILPTEIKQSASICNTTEYSCRGYSSCFNPPPLTNNYFDCFWRSRNNWLKYVRKYEYTPDELQKLFLLSVVVWYRDAVITPWFTSLSHCWSKSFSTRYHQCNIAWSATGLDLLVSAKTLLLNTVHVHRSPYWVSCAIFLNGFGRHPNLWTITKDGKNFNRAYFKLNEEILKFCLSLWSLYF